MPSDPQAATSDVDAPEATPPHRAGWANDKSLFAGRVAVIFLTKIAQFLFGGATLFLVAALLEPTQAGEYSLLLVWIGLLFAFGQLGMPSAMTFMAGRGGSAKSLERISLGLTLGITAAIAAVAIAALPFLEGTVLRALGGSSATTSDDLLRLVLLALPMLLLTQFGAGILYTRGLNRAYNRIQVATAGAMLVLTGILIGVVPFGVSGAVVAYLVANGFGAVAVVYEVHKLATHPDDAHSGAVPFGAFAKYGLKLYPQSITSFFSYRADVLLLSWMLGDPKLLIYYSVAVRIAEMTFYVPDSISAMLYPAISASTREDADRLAPAVSRLAMLTTFLASLAVIPVGFVAIWGLLRPEYHAAFPALVVIMPGVLSLSLSKVLASYVSGLGRPIATTVAGIVGLSVNIGANLVLIPRLGIVGASAASLISYTCHAMVLLYVASRWAKVSPLAFVVPRRAEFERVRRMAMDGLAKVLTVVGRRRGPAAG
jgi:O-antigen/teichoic acid export membrane protein